MPSLTGQWSSHVIVPVCQVGWDKTSVRSEMTCHWVNVHVCQVWLVGVHAKLPSRSGRCYWPAVVHLSAICYLSAFFSWTVAKSSLRSVRYRCWVTTSRHLSRLARLAGQTHSGHLSDMSGLIGRWLIQSFAVRQIWVVRSYDKSSVRSVRFGWWRCLSVSWSDRCHL